MAGQSGGNGYSEERINALAEAYKHLREEDRISIAKAIFKYAQPLFKSWVQAAGLNRGGYQEKNIAQRGRPHIASALDRVLLQTSNKFLYYIAMIFFDNAHPPLADKLRELRPETGIRTAEQFEALLLNVCAQHSQDPFINFFETSSWCRFECGQLEFGGEAADKAGEDVPSETGEAHTSAEEDLARNKALKDALDQMEDAALRERIQAGAEALKEAIGLTQEAATGLTPMFQFHSINANAACKTIQALSALLEQMERWISGFYAELQLGTPDWKDLPQLVECLVNIAQAGLAREQAARQTRSLANMVGDVMQRMAIQHRTRRERERYDGMRKAAAAELLSGAQFPTPPLAIADGRAWLEWTFGLSEENGLTQLRDQLEENFPNLLCFLETCPLDSIVWPEPLAGDPEPAQAPTPSADAGPEKVESSDCPVEAAEVEEVPEAATAPAPAQVAAFLTEVSCEAVLPEVQGAAAEAPAGLLEETGSCALETVALPAAASETPENAVDAPALTPAARTDAMPAAGNGTRRAVEPDAQPRASRPCEPATSAVADEPDQYETLILNALRANRYALAYHMTRTLEGLGRPVRIPSELILALACSRWVDGPEHARFKRLKDAWEKLATWLDSEQATLPARLLALAATLRPSLLAPHEGAADALSRVNFDADFSNLNLLRDQVLEAQQIANFSLTLLRFQDQHQKWDERLATLRQQASKWLSNQSRAELRFHAATSVWHYWLATQGRQDDSRGVIGRMVQRIIDDRTAEPAEIIAWLGTWTNRKSINDKITDADRELRDGARVNPIDGPALVDLHRNCTEAAGLVRQWLELIQGAPDRVQNWISKQVEHLRGQLLRKIAESRQALACEQSSSPEFEMATHLLRVRLDDLEALIDLDRLVEGRHPMDPLGLVCDELLLQTSVELQDLTWWPANPASPADLAALGELAKAAPPPLQGVFERCWTAGRFHQAMGLFDLLESRQGDPELVIIPPPAEQLNPLREEHQSRLVTARDELQRALEDVRRELDRALVKRQLAGELAMELKTRLDILEPASITNIAEARRVLSEVRTRIEQEQIERLETARQQFQSLLEHEKGDIQQLAQRYRGRIEAILGDKDVITVNEYLANIENGRELPQAPAAGESLPDFFEFLDECYRFLMPPPNVTVAQVPTRAVAETLKARGTLGSLDLRRALTPHDAELAARTFRAWMELTAPNITPEARLKALREIFGFIGFDIRAIQPAGRAEGNRANWFVLTAEPIIRRGDCILPDFGSKAGGRYKVVLLPNRPLANEILDDTRVQSPDSSPVIALFFGRMSSRRRRELAHALRRERRDLLLALDEILLLYVACQKKRLLAFFNAAGAFSRAVPYATTSSNVLPEMFYGRGEEIEKVISPEGTNLVYGGRQLGKTALLREVVRRYHNPKAQHIVLWIDLLHGENFGGNRPIGDIWPVIANHLRSYGILSPNTSTYTKIKEEIVRWLSQDDTRRIVLLLDEADCFLENDARAEGQRWAHVGYLKTIMEETRRRFKVVFTGLHNVQRTSHDVNTPLAHMGEPIQIGPFFGKEIAEAYTMIKLPFEAMGYRFASDDLIGRILAHTNYYPSLIQLFCSKLLQQLAEPVQRFELAHTPPYIITLNHIENAYADRDLRKSIADRFRWTVELDPRYRVIALLIAILASERREMSVNGLSVNEIRKMALSYWEKGFGADANFDDFYTLLDEMVGLGILSRKQGNCFALRSPNVIELLSAESDLWNQLDDAINAPPKLVYEANSFRRTYSQDQDWRRSPLTDAQESRIIGDREMGVRNRSIVLVGSQAAGLDEVRPFLERLVGPEGESRSTRLCWIDDETSLAAWLNRLQIELDDRTEGLLLLVVSANCPWSVEWVLQGNQAIQRRKSARNRVVRVVFLCDPKGAWPLVRTDGLDRLESAEGVELLALSTWKDAALRRWKREIQIGQDTDEDILRFRRATGLWHHFILDAGLRCKVEPHQWVSTLEHYALEMRRKASQSLQLFGLEPVPSRILRAMAILNVPINPEQLWELEPDLIESSERLASVFRYLDLLSLIRPTEDKQWTVDPFITDLISASEVQD